VIVDKLDLENVSGKLFYRCANLAPQQPLTGQVFGQGHDI
jgi:hypothetical protein